MLHGTAHLPSATPAAAQSRIAKQFPLLHCIQSACCSAPHHLATFLHLRQWIAQSVRCHDGTCSQSIPMQCSRRLIQHAFDRCRILPAGAISMFHVCHAFEGAFLLLLAIMLASTMPITIAFLAYFCYHTTARLSNCDAICEGLPAHPKDARHQLHPDEALYRGVRACGGYEIVHGCVALSGSTERNCQLGIRLVPTCRANHTHFWHLSTAQFWHSVVGLFSLPSVWGDPAIADAPHTLGSALGCRP